MPFRVLSFWYLEFSVPPKPVNDLGGHRPARICTVVIFDSKVQILMEHDGTGASDPILISKYD